MEMYYFTTVLLFAKLLILAHVHNYQTQLCISRKLKKSFL